MKTYADLIKRLRTPQKGHAEQVDNDKLAAASAIESLEFQLACRIEKAESTK